MTLEPSEDLPTLVDEDVVDEDLVVAVDPARPVRRRGLGIRLDDLVVAADHEAARADRAGHGLVALLGAAMPGVARAAGAGLSPAALAAAAAEQQRQARTAALDPRGDGQLLAEAQWLLTPTSHVLHHHAPDPAGGAQLLVDGWIEQDGDPVPLDLSCGRTAWTVIAPNALERRTTPRCEDCCAALGMPDGLGSPVNDPACEPTLTGRITAVTHPASTPSAAGSTP